MNALFAQKLQNDCSAERASAFGAVVTVCSNRKRAEPDAALRARTLPDGTSGRVAAAWAARLAGAQARQPARALYGGRAFREAEAAASQTATPLLVVSAGLGLISADTAVPAYGLTLGRSHPDGILPRLSEGGPQEWWREMTTASPIPQATLPDRGLLLAALPAPYLEMIAHAWAAWAPEQRARLRLFSKSAPTGAAAPLAANWMPYDDRLDRASARHAGTQADFAQRALAHFVGLAPRAQSGLEADRAAVSAALAGHEAAKRPERLRRTDAEVIALITAEWDRAQGQSSKLLRRLRDDLGIACEQSRFKTLFHHVRNLREAIP